MSSYLVHLSSEGMSVVVPGSQSRTGCHRSKGRRCCPRCPVSEALVEHSQELHEASEASLRLKSSPVQANYSQYRRVLDLTFTLTGHLTLLDLNSNQDLPTDGHPPGSSNARSSARQGASWSALPPGPPQSSPWRSQRRTSSPWASGRRAPCRGPHPGRHPGCGKPAVKRHAVTNTPHHCCYYWARWPVQLMAATRWSR